MPPNMNDQLSPARRPKLKRQLSERGERALTPMLSYLPMVLKSWEDLFDPEKNPNGKIALCVSENVLAYPLLKPMLRKTAVAALDSTGVNTYGACRGRLPFRESISRFMSKNMFTGVSVDPEHVTVANGVTSILDVVGTVLLSAV